MDGGARDKICRQGRPDHITPPIPSCFATTASDPGGFTRETWAPGVGATTRREAAAEEEETGRGRGRGRGPRGGGLLVGWFCLVRPGSPRSPAVIARQEIDRVFDRVPPSSTGARARRTAPSSWSRSPPGSRAASPPILAGGSQRWRTVPPADRDSCLAGGSASVQVASVWRKTAGFSQNA